MAIINSPRISGNINTTNGVILLPIEGCSTVSFQLTGTYVGTVIAEGSINDIDYFPIQLFRDSVGYQPLVLSSASFGLFYGSCGMYTSVRLRMVSYTSGSLNVNIMASISKCPLLTNARYSDLSVTTTSAVGVIATLTLPSPGTGLFHYITQIIIESHKGSLVTAQTTPNIVTTTNLNGLVFSMPYEGISGSSFIKEIKQSTPIRSQASNTATTIVYPATTGVIPRLTAFYYTGL